VVAKVTNIDTATNRITMQAPNGEELQLRVRDPQAVSSLKTGDRVITNGGIIGVITMVRESSFLIRSADKTILEVARTAIADIDHEGKQAG